MAEATKMRVGVDPAPKAFLALLMEMPTVKRRRPPPLLHLSWCYLKKR